MATLTIAESLLIFLIVSLTTLIIITGAVSRRGHAMKRVPLVMLILGAFVLGTACSTTYSSNSAGHNSSKHYSAKKSVGYVKRAIFTTAIKNREPADSISELQNNRRKIYYFTDLRGMQGQKVRHRWIYKGKVRAEVEFKVGGPRWRVFSSKWLERGWLGDWTVLTVDRRGRTLSRSTFSYTTATGFLGEDGKAYIDLFGED